MFLGNGPQNIIPPQSYIMHTLRKIETLDNFDMIVFENLNENSEENDILRKIRTYLETILFSLKIAFETKPTKFTSIALPCSFGEGGHFYDDSIGGVIRVSNCNTFEVLPNVMSTFLYSSLRAIDCMLAVTYTTTLL